MIYDIIIIGLGPAGYSAGVYATRYNMKTLIIGEEPGGLVVETTEIENWSGDRSVKGTDLMERMNKHYTSLGGEVKEGRVADICKNKNIFGLKLANGDTYKARSVILATGTRPRTLNAQGEDKFKGRGVSYCATCDAPFFKDKVVAVIGGGDAAFMSALHLSEFAKKVYIIHRRDKFRAMPSNVDKLKKKAAFMMNKTLKSIEGKIKVDFIELEDVRTKEIQKLEVDGVFIQVGHIPITALSECMNVKTKNGFIAVKEDMSTNVPGFFAAGDCTNGSNSLRQIVTATSEGAIAATSAYNYINEKK